MDHLEAIAADRQADHPLSCAIAVPAIDTAPAVGALLNRAAAAVAALSLAACGGAEDNPLPAAFSNQVAAVTDRRILSAAGKTGELGAQSAAPPMLPPTPTELMDWAEYAYAGFFPGHKPNLTSPPYIYRYYPETGNYLGVDGEDIYILGPVAGNVLTFVGTLTEFTSRVFAIRQAATDVQAARFLTQATLGPTDESIAAVRSLGYDAWLTQEFARPVSTSNWDWLISKGIDAGDPNISTGIDSQIWQRLLTAPDSLRQRVTLALSEIFVVGFDGITGSWKQFKLAAWWDLLANGAFGNYRALIENITLNPAMGLYLNAAGNQKEDVASGRVPDENYAREVMQLFSIGVSQLNADGTPVLDGRGEAIDSYTQDTVSQLARVFTGWNLTTPRNAVASARNPMVLTASLHSTLSVSFLGTTIAAGTAGAAALQTALNTLANHPNVGPFLAQQLIQKLVTSNPSAAYVGRVAARFNDNGAGVRGDLSAVVRAVLTDYEARNVEALANPQFGKLREPMLRFIQWARSFNATSTSGSWNVGNTTDPATRLGQSPLRSPSVFNYFRPGYVPAGSPIAAVALVAPEFQLANESSIAGYLNYMQTAVGNGHADIKPHYDAELALASDANALLDRLDRLLCAGQLQASTRSTISTAINSISASTDAGKANRVYTAVLLVLASPDYLIQK